MHKNHELQTTQQVLGRVLELAKQQGATSAEAGASFSHGFSVTVRMGEVETLEHNRDKRVDIHVYVGQQSGSASTGDFTEEALQLTVAKAVSIAKYTNSDPFAGLAEANLLAFDYPDLKLSYPWAITPKEAIDIALRCENTARAQDKRITNSEGATLSTHDYTVGYANSNNFIGTYKTTRHNLSCALIASDGHQMYRDYDYTVARDHTDMVDPEQLAQNTAQRTLRRLGARKISTRECPVIFYAEVARELLGSFVCAISGDNLYRRATFLYDHLDQPVFASHVQIKEQPHIIKALGSAPFDAEGVLTRTKDLVKDGILQSYLLDSYSARKLNMHTTGNAGGIHNLIINTTNKTLPDLLQQMGTGLLVTEIMGQGVNIVTGDYSRGIFGYWVENGEIQYPVQEVTIASNLKDMFMNLIAVANDVDRRGSIHSGSILISKMTVAGE